MLENFKYPDAREMYRLHNILEELINDGDPRIDLYEGSHVYTDPDLDFLLRILFTPVENRYSYLRIWGDKDQAYRHLSEDIRKGTFQDITIEKFEEKRKAWIDEIKETDHPMLRILKAIQYGREVDSWETRKHFLELVADRKRIQVCMEICGSMILKGYTFTQIAEVVPGVTKADIYGLSRLLKCPLELTKQENKEVEKEYRKTGEPKILREVFGEPDTKISK